METYQAMNARHLAERAPHQQRIWDAEREMNLARARLRVIRDKHFAERTEWYHVNRARKAAK